MKDKTLFICLILSTNLSVNWAASQWKNPYFIAANENVTVEGDNKITITEWMKKDDILGTLQYEGDDNVYFFYSISDDPNGIFSSDDKLFSFNKADKTLILNKEVDTDLIIEDNFNWPSTTIALVSAIKDCNQNVCKTSTITYEDVNDKLPEDVPRESFNFAVPENNEDAIDLLTINATDTETYGNDSYRSMTIIIKDPPENNPFSFHKLGTINDPSLNKWVLRIEKNGLDYENVRLYPLEIQITDHPDRFGTKHSPEPFPITVRVTDEGDNPPQWQQSCRMINIPEQNSIGDPLFTVKARDPDSGINNEITYKIVKITDNNNATHNFATIDQDGEVTMNKTVDRESDEYKYLGSPMYFTLSIQPKEKNCVENCTGSTLECPLSISDIDDKPPIFEELNNYTITLNENQEPGEIFSVLTSDADAYPFDRYSITIVNSSDPTLDLKVNPETVNGNPAVNVSISTTTDSLLDYEKNHQVFFTVELTGDANPSMNSSKKFTININDMNDNSPEFNQPTYTINIKEDLSDIHIGVDGNYDLGLEVKAFDDDETQTFGNASLVYGLKNASGSERWLLLDQSTGKITINKTYSTDINYEEVKSHTVEVQVTDCYDDASLCSKFGGVRSNKNSTTITLIIEDVNDEMPKLDQVPKIEVCIYENDPNLWPTSSCGQNSYFTASDEDSGAQLQLDIDWSKSTAKKNGNDLKDDDWKETLLLQKNSIDLEKGNRSLTAYLIPNGEKFLDYEKVDHLTLLIYARDKNATGDSQHVNLTVTVNVRDINDNFPSFDPEEVFGVIDSGTESGTVVLTIKASDLDDGDVDSSGLNFTILEIDTSHATIEDIENPFKIEDKPQFEANVRINFSPQSNIAGYFILKTKVADEANQKQERNYSIIVTTLKNKCKFVFTQDLVSVEQNILQVTDIFSDVFTKHSFGDWHGNWSFQHIKVERGQSEQKGTVRTEVTSYFIKDRKEAIPRDYVGGTYMYSVIELSEKLSKIGLHLDPSEGMSDIDESAPEGDSDTLGITFGIISAFATFLLIGLFITYWIRTSNLERKVKALGIEVDDERTTKTKKPDKIMLAGLQENFPGSNEFAESGANPIWQVAMESTDFEENFKMDDSMSESSGDSILIGVEDQRDFSTLEEVDIDVDMDLYANLNKRRLDPPDEGRDGGLEWSRGRLDDDYPGDEAPEMFTISRPGNPLAGGNPLYNSDDEEDEI